MSITFNRFGLVKAKTNERQTYTDIDDATAPPLRRVWWIARVIGSKPEWVRYDRTKHGWHLIVQWPKATFRERCDKCGKTHTSHFAILALQSILGSDFRREALNFMRVSSLGNSARDRRRWNILYERKLYK